MRLAIISDCIHMKDENGNVASENHVFIRQMQALADHFSDTIICCPFVEFSADKVISTYTHPSIRFLPLPKVGGNSVKHKLQLIKTMPVWFSAFKKLNHSSDFIYQRFPNNLNLPGLFYFYFSKAKTFATYTGTWKNYRNEPATYRFQKWLLKNWFKGPVWAYSAEEISQTHIRKGFSPSYTSMEWAEESQQVALRIQRIKDNPDFAPVFISVGAMVENKNQLYILKAFKILLDLGFAYPLYLVGDGPLKTTFQQFIIDYGLSRHVFLTGKKTVAELRSLYRKADFLIQAPLAEGFGKAPVEAFFHGVIPLLNRTAMATEMTGNQQRGFLFSANDPLNLVNLIVRIQKERSILSNMIVNGRKYAFNQTLENWANDYFKTVNEYFE